MKMLIMPPYFFPELTASTHLDNDRFDMYSKNRIEAKVITPIPTRGVSKLTRRQTPKNETLYDGKVTVKRFCLFREGRNPLLRAIRYVIQELIQARLGIKEEGVDIVYSGSTPPTQGLLCGYVKKRLSKKYKRKVPFVYCLQDIFPDSAVNAGLIKVGSISWRLGRRIEDYTYKVADKIIVISEDFRRNIVAKGVPEDKIVIVSNWIDLESVMPIHKEDNTLFAELGIDSGKFIVVYAGNIGEAQGFDVVLESAKKLQFYTDIQFVVFGGGSRYDAVADYVKYAKIKNLIITPLQPQERVSEVYSMGDIALITCKSGTGGAGMPSKTWSIMACNTTIVASYDLDSDLSLVLENSGAGFCVEPENADLLTEAIINMYKNRDKNHCYNFRDYVKSNASKEKCVMQYIDTFKAVVE